jgi:hypothetical protein
MRHCLFWGKIANDYKEPSASIFWLEDFYPEENVTGISQQRLPLSSM